MCVSTGQCVMMCVRLNGSVSVYAGFVNGIINPFAVPQLADVYLVYAW